MFKPSAMPNPATGVALALGAAVVLSINDMSIKALSGAYPLHQIILVRGLVGLGFILCLIKASPLGFSQLRTGRPWHHLLRTCFVLCSNATYFMGLAAMPLADAVAISYVAPVLITLLSIFLLREKVGPHRLFAVALGLMGTLVLMRPGEGAFQLAGVLVLISALSYSLSQMMTRTMRGTESALSISFYVQIGFLVFSSLVGLMLGDGKFAGASDASIAFLTRAWMWPEAHHLAFFLISGVAVALGGVMMQQAYRTMEAAVVAPFEYAAIPMAIFWGAVLFGTLPDATGLMGMALILTAGLYTLWREQIRKRNPL